MSSIQQARQSTKFTDSVDIRRPSRERKSDGSKLVKRMLVSSVGCVCLLGFPSRGEAATQYTFYAAPNGSGSTCSVAAPCSLAGVQTKVRTVNSNLTGDVVVYLRGGTYALTQPWKLTQLDSGSGGYQVIYAAYSGEKPLISGGQSVTGWQVFDSSKNIYRANVGTSLQTRQLYVNGVRASRARGPMNPSGFTYKASYGFDTSDASLQNLARINEIEVAALNEWKVLRCGVASIVGSKITLDQPCWTNAHRHYVKFDRVTWLENAYEFIDQEAEWYLDRSAGYLYYKPRVGENLASAETIVATGENLLIGAGTADAPIHHITFTGITFAYNTWLRPNTTEGYPPIQAGFLYYNSSDEAVDGFKTPAAVTFTFANTIKLERNVFEKLGSAGINFEYGSQNNTVVGNRFQDISSSAIQLGHINESHPADVRRILKNNVISDNYINKIAQEYFDGVGILAVYTENSLIEHNDLSDLPYSGISVGWGWGKPDVGGKLGFTTPTPAKQNKIQYNSITRFMTILRDGGGVYTLGSQPSSTINNNFISQMAGGNGGLYLDEATQYYDVNNNVVESVPSWLHIWTKTIKNNSVRFNFSNTTNKLNRGTNNTVSDNQEGLKSWPSAANTIISNAGLRAKYADIKGPSGPGNIALKKATSASSEYSTQFRAPLATDGSNTTGWSPSGTDLRPWLQVDLGSAHVIQRAEFVPRQDIDQPSTRRDFEVRASNDPSFASFEVLASPGSTPFAHRATWSAAVTNTKSYRYVRLAKTVDDYLFVNEFRVIATPPASANVALRKTAAASSAYNADYAASKVIDGSNSGGWSPTGTDRPSYVQIDLGQEYALSSINLVTRQGLDQPETRRNFEIRASNNSNMSLGYAVLGGVGSEGVPYQGTFNLPITGAPRYRYIAIVKTQPEYFFVAEVQVFGTP